LPDRECFTRVAIAKCQLHKCAMKARAFADAVDRAANDKCVKQQKDGCPEDRSRKAVYDNRTTLTHTGPHSYESRPNTSAPILDRRPLAESRQGPGLALACVD